jgi:peptide/nickel transport system permease protein
MLIILIGVSLFAFLLSYATGDPTTLLLSPNATQAEIEAFRKHIGLDQPVWIQYGRFVYNILQGEFPRSLTYNQDSFSLLLERLPATLLLVFSSMALAIFVSFPLGLFLAWRRTSWYTPALMSLTIIGYSTPIYWEAIILVLIFSITLGLLPPSGYGSFKHLILPAFAIATQQAALLVRMIWGSAVEVLNTDYVLTVRAKGVSEFAVLLKHVLPNCMIPVVTILGLQFAGLMGNAIMAEVIFAWPGVARLTVQAIFYRDYPLVQACVIFMAFIFVIANLTVDVAYGILDPRVRYK